MPPTPDDTIIYRDVALEPPAPVTGEWIHAAFTPPAQREPWMLEALVASDALVAELMRADLIVAKRASGRLQDRADLRSLLRVPQPRRS